MNLTTVITKRDNKTIYRDGEKIIKLMNENYTAVNALNEALNHAIVSDTGFKVPKIHEVIKIDGKWGIVMEYIEGKTLAVLMEENPGKEDEYIDLFVDLQIKMHEYRAPRLSHLTDKMHQKISETAGIFDATVRYELHTRLNGQPKQNNLCHGDFGPGNIIITPQGETYVIDWSHATQGNANGDVARTFLRSHLAKKDAWAEKYINVYCKKSDTARQDIEKWMAIVAASQSVKRVPEEKDLLLRWANVIEYE